MSTLIYERLAAIMADVPAIPKGQQNKQQGYAFRGIDDMYDALHGLFVKHQVFILPEVIESEYVDRERRLQDNLNRIGNLIPGSSRLWELHRIAMELDGEADRLAAENVPGSDPDGLRKDALYLRRLEYDLISMREAVGRPVRGTANRKYDPSQWARGPRP